MPRPIPLYGAEPVGLQIFQNGKLTDPDGLILNLNITNTDNGAAIVPGELAEQEAEGIYQFTLNSNQTAVIGNYQTTWTYTLGGSPRTYVDPFVIPGLMPVWQTLLPQDRQIVYNVYSRLGNGFDSNIGGPYLQTLIQSGFNAYEVFGTLLYNEVLSYFNFEFQPPFYPPYEVGVNANHLLPELWYGLLEEGLYVSCLRHLQRSYLEQPEVVNSSLGRLDRRDYFERWERVWLQEKEIYDKMLRQFKRRFLVGSKRSTLVAGGLIPRMMINPARPSWVYGSHGSTGGI